MRITGENCFLHHAFFCRHSVQTKGFLFSFDALVAFFCICLIAIVSLQLLNSSVKENLAVFPDFEREKNAVMLIDSIVKNSSRENSALGAAVFSEEKHRVLENSIDSEWLKKADAWVSEKIFLKSAELFFKDGEKQVLLDFSAGKNCLGVERLVLVDGKKALLKAVVCSE